MELVDGTGDNPNEVVQVVEGEDPREFIDVTVGCWGNVDKEGTTNHEKRRRETPLLKLNRIKVPLEKPKEKETRNENRPDCRPRS